VCVIRASGVDEAVRIANDTEYGLSAAVYGRDITRALAVAKRIESEMCHINGPISTVILGMCTVGVVPVVLGRVQEILPNNHVGQQASWSRATIAFALFQALSGYGYAFLFSHTGENYGLIFLCGLIALTAVLLVDIFVRPEGRM
jgi:FtsH-binding integral membrane protein